MYWSFVFLLLYALAYSLHGFFAFLFLQNEVSRIYPSPLGPNPTPGVVTT